MYFTDDLQYSGSRRFMPFSSICHHNKESLAICYVANYMGTR
jgi:hypothetical protein